MNWTQLSIGTLLGGITYFLLGWLVYGILLMDLMALPEEFQQIVYPEEEFKVVLMVLSSLVWGLLLTYVVRKGGGTLGFANGFGVGAIVGVLISLSVGLGMASMYRFSNIPNVLIDMVGNGVISGLAGGVIGWWLGRGNKAAA